MIDISNLATKQDLERFATKEDLKRFATKEDLKQFATKKDLKRVEDKLDEKASKLDMQTFIEHIDEKFDALIEILSSHMDNAAMRSELQELREEHRRDHRLVTRTIAETNKDLQRLERRVQSLHD